MDAGDLAEFQEATTMMKDLLATIRAGWDIAGEIARAERAERRAARLEAEIEARVAESALLAQGWEECSAMLKSADARAAQLAESRDYWKGMVEERTAAVTAALLAQSGAIEAKEAAEARAAQLEQERDEANEIAERRFDKLAQAEAEVAALRAALESR